jgi:hypothetical protein
MLAEGLAPATSNIDIERLAGSGDAESSSASPSSDSDSSSNTPRKRNSQPMEMEKVIGDRETRGNLADGLREYILLCRPSGKETVLKHANVTQAQCDRSSYNTLHRKHFGKYYRYLKWIYMTEIASVEFVKVRRPIYKI